MQRINALIFGLILTTLSSWAGAVDLAQKPVFLNPPDPRMMLVMSRDHQLSMKAYNDYSDLNGDGVLDTTYTDAVEYYGYFNPDRCYTYNSGSARFEPAGAVSSGTHACSSQWSGNFLNWASMTRMDVLRKTLYGGYRSTDNDGIALGDTVLERAMLPNDVHAFGKIYAPAGGATDVAKFTPYSDASISICNVTPATTGMSNVTTVAPALQVATGSWPNWAFYDGSQCGGGTGVAGDKPASGSITTLTARVAVCVTGKEEANCTTYGSNKKPTGLLQKYGESTAAARVRFGLLTGSYTKNKSGGVLRKNTAWMSGNATAADNEINPGTGLFINQGATDTGIVNTINRFRIAGWDFNAKKHQNSCNSPGLLSFNDGQCVDWGNPLSEMYLESLRYFAGKASPTAAFNTSDAAQIPSLPQLTWSDPLPSTEWCALSNTVVLSTGLGSFDDDQLSGFDDVDPAALTTAVGVKEGIMGDYLIGDNTLTTSDNQCTGKTLANLANAKGICPEGPSLKGTYFIAGLAYSNQTVDLRAAYKALRTNRWGNPAKGNYKPEYVARQPMGTYTVALAESLPTLDIPVSGGNIKFLPACQAQSNTPSNAISNDNPPSVLQTNNWRVCSLTDLKILSMAADGKSGSMQASWEDSTWGNDYDLDGIAQLDFCVGTACGGGVAANQIKITARVIYAAAGHALRFGYTVTGSGNDGTYLDILRRGGVNVPTLGPKAGVTGPTFRTFTLGSSAARLLENPLWYAAKYARSDWDTKNNTTGATGADGVPDNFFKVTNPAGLSAALGKVFEDAAKADASASAIATNSTRLDTNTHVYQALFHTPGWYGELKAIPLDSNGVPGTPSWDASAEIPAAASRNIKTWNGLAWNAALGAGTDFNWASITGSQQAALVSTGILSYIRGDQTNEQPSGTYRTRTTLLGDIVNSDPHYVAVESYGYDQPGSGLPATEQVDYTTFRTNTTTGKPARKKMLYVGSNDGMLHAINAANTAALGGGDELFTYVPSAVIPNLKNLVNPDYQHQYFVDGSPNSGDAYLGGAWKTVLLGTLGAGGKAVFALDVTDPDLFDASKVMWEFTDATDLGNIMGRAFVARMNDGNWYAVFGNGYNSTGAKAVLFLVPLDKSLGLPVIKIDTLVDTDNGLSEPALLDTNGDRIIDAIYAGDLRGNVWKFDVSNASTSNWKSAYTTGMTPNPLFQAKIGTTEQPIISPIEIGAPPSGESGYMIYFGTGKYLGNSDIIPQAQLTSSTYTQTGYGILDAGAKITGGRSDLQAQTFVYEGAVSGTNPDQVRVVSNNAVSYSGGGAKKGWYLDLLSPNSPTYLGERIVSVPLLRYGRVIFTSIVPSAAVCDQGGYSWLTEVDAFSGARLTYSVFDFNADNLFNSGDYVTYTSGGSSVTSAASGKKLASEGLLKSPTVISAGEKEYKVGSGTAGGIVVVSEKGTTGTPRTSWRQLFPQ